MYYYFPNTMFNIFNHLKIKGLLCNTITRNCTALQNPCLRFSYNISSRQHVTIFYKNLNVLKLEFCFKLYFAVFSYKMMCFRKPSMQQLTLGNMHELLIPRRKTKTLRAVLHQGDKAVPVLPLYNS